MSDRMSRGVEAVIIGLTCSLLVLVFAPWVKTGVLQETDTVNGIDIPVIGWSTVVMGMITLALAIVAFLRGGRWWWCGYVFSLGLMITGATVVLATLDVMDSSIVGWITKALPDDLEQASPQLQATFMLWFAYSLALVALGAGSYTAVVRVSRDTENEGELSAWGPSSAPDASSFAPIESPWATEEPTWSSSPWGDQEGAPTPPWK